MATPAEVVADVLSNAEAYASTAETKLTSFTNALNNAIYAAPTFTVTWTAIDAPTSLSMPAVPASMSSLEAEFEWDSDGSIAASKPGSLSVAAPSIVIDDFTEVAPVLDFGTQPVLDFGTKPTLDFGSKPVVPAITDVTVPDAPSIVLPSTPSYLALTTPTFAGVDLHSAFLTNLETVPSLTLVAPTPYTYSPGPQYASDLLTQLKTNLLARINSGTGLDPAVEAAIWDRARDRETNTAQAQIDDVTRMNESLGWDLPTGALTSALQKAQQGYYEKVSDLSRDIAIKQADLEQANLKHTIEHGMALESKLIDYSVEMERLAFENAKTIAANAIDAYNAQVNKFQAVVQGYTAYANAYDALMKGELAKVEVFRAEVAAEQAKADTNRTLVMQYQASIEAQLALVKVFESQVGGAKARMDLEAAKLAAVREEINAYVAGINGETARLEAWKVGIQGETARVDNYRAGVQAELAKVESFRAKADAFRAKVGAQGEKARADLSYYQARVQAYTSEWEGWRARVQGEAARFNALMSKSNAILDSYKAQVSTVLAQSQQDTERWRIGISQYEAQQNYLLGAAKLNADVIQANSSRLLEAAKVGAQVYAQLTSSAYGIVNASAAVSAGSNMAVSYSYSNDTTAAVAPVTTV